MKIDVIGQFLQSFWIGEQPQTQTRLYHFHAAFHALSEYEIRFKKKY